MNLKNDPVLGPMLPPYIWEILELVERGTTTRADAAVLATALISREQTIRFQEQLARCEKPIFATGESDET